MDILGEKTAQQLPFKIHIGKALKQTLTSLFYPQVVLLFFVPFLISMLFVMGFLWLTWGFWSSLFAEGLLYVDPYWQNFLQSTPQFLVEFFETLRPALPFILFIGIFALAFPLVIVLNLVMTSFFTSTYLVHFIAKRDYPHLAEMGKSRNLAGLWNGIKYALLYLGLWLVTFPLWLIPGAQLALPIILTAWLNRQVCTFDALTDFATDEEFVWLREKSKSPGYILGLVTAGLNYIPLALFISPVLTMVAYIYLGLESLDLYRKSAKPQQ